MPHKNNAVAAISARACARRAPGLVATLLSAMEQEHERSAGGWHSEWPTLTSLLASVGSAASWLAESLGSLHVDTARMAATVAASGEGSLARALAVALEPTLGKGAAHDAPVVVLSSSLGATRGMWDPQVPALAERYRVVTYDTRGHGDSPAPQGPYALDDLVDDVVALLDRLGARTAHVAGLSLGGVTAMRLAAREPAL